MTGLARGAAVFVDRDGTLIREVGYLRRVDQVEILPGVPEALALLREFGFKAVMVTNQSAVARGWLSEDELGRIHGALNAELALSGVSLDGIYYCPHHPTEGIDPYRLECRCRKPGTGMVERACAELRLDCAASYVVGDQESDMELAARVGAAAVLINGENGPTSEIDIKPAALARDFLTAARWIVGQADRRVKRASLR